MKTRVELEIDGVKEAEKLMAELDEKLQEADKLLEELRMVSYRMGLLVKIDQPA